ncbi:unnamed protein product [Absidia cylindrospora]
MMTLASELKHIKYVWVDAICVDQHNPVRRKETIYQMSNIYDRAAYILAVPDLHLAYLKGVSPATQDIIENSNEYGADIYHLINQNKSQLDSLEEKFLNDAQVPEDPPALRQLLLTYTDHFAQSFMSGEKRHDDLYCPMLALDHIADTINASHHHWRNWIKGNKSYIGDLHQCQQNICPLVLFDKFKRPETATSEELEKFYNSKWKSRIVKRSTAIRQSVEFLTALIKDWSSRVWVISEYSIAKRENKLKYWFIQLALDSSSVEGKYGNMDEEFTFFEFDFQDHTYSEMVKYAEWAHRVERKRLRSNASTPVSAVFNITMVSQLNQQTFLEMILCSKASKNEDRFYSILPLSEYGNKIMEVSQWEISSMVSVKLKLYEIMNTKDKLALFFWSSNKHTMKNDILPTFATSTLDTEGQTEYLEPDDDSYLNNFDLNDPSTIMLHHHQQPHNESTLYYLRLKPKSYIMVSALNSDKSNDLDTKSLSTLRRLGIDTEDTTSLNVAYIPVYSPDGHRIGYGGIWYATLFGCFAKNKWILSKHYCSDEETLSTGDWLYFLNPADFPPTFFDIY